MKKQRTLRIALRAALTVAVVGTSGSIAGAQQTDLELPALPTHVSAPTGGDLQLPQLPSLPNQQIQESGREHVARLFGFSSRTKPTTNRSAKLPQLPSATPEKAEAKITWTSRQPNTGASWTVNPHVATADTGSTSAVVAASAHAPASNDADDTTPVEDSHAITMTISGSAPSDSLIDVDIPLMLPSYDNTAPEPTVPARQPEIVTKKTQMRLSDSNPSRPADASPSMPGGPDAQKSATKFSLSDASTENEITPPQPPSAAPAAPQLTDMVPTRPAIEAQLPAAPLLDVSAPSIQRTGAARELSSRQRQLGTPEPASKLVPVQLGKDDLPSTASSRGGVTERLSDSAQSSRKPMQVVIEGQPARVVGSDTAAEFGSSNDVPKPTFDTTRDNPANRYQVAEQSSLPSPRPVRARLASQTQTVSSRTDGGEAFESSRKSEKARNLPPEALAKMTRLSVVVEQAVPMSVRSSIVQTSVEDPSVCQLIQSGDRSLSLVGLKAGSTRVAIVTSTDGSEPKVRVYEVSVGRGSKAEYGLTELAAGIDETVSRLYPSNRIRVAAGDGRLVVSGTAESEEEARRVLALVRRTSLMPVTDQLRTQ